VSCVELSRICLEQPQFSKHNEQWNLGSTVTLHRVEQATTQIARWLGDVDRLVDFLSKEEAIDSFAAGEFLSVMEGVQ